MANIDNLPFSEEERKKYTKKIEYEIRETVGRYNRKRENKPRIRSATYVHIYRQKLALLRR